MVPLKLLLCLVLLTPDATLAQKARKRKLRTRRTPAPAPRVNPLVEAKKEQSRRLGDAHIQQYQSGNWMYGDRAESIANDAAQCEKACEADPECYHWNFHLMGHKCQLKAYGGSLDTDKVDWITGDLGRYSTRKLAEEAAQKAAEKAEE